MLTMLTLSECVVLLVPWIIRSTMALWLVISVRSACLPKVRCRGLCMTVTRCRTVRRLLLAAVRQKVEMLLTCYPMQKLISMLPCLEARQCLGLVLIDSRWPLNPCMPRMNGTPKRRFGLKLVCPIVLNRNRTVRLRLPMTNREPVRISVVVSRLKRNFAPTLVLSVDWVVCAVVVDGPDGGYCCVW